MAELFGRFPSISANGSSEPAPPFAPTTLVEQRDSNQSHLRMSYRPSIEARAPAERAALTVYSTLLGGSMGSRLFDEIREQRGLAYSVYAIDHTFADVPILQLSAGLDSTKCVEAYTRMREIVDELRTDGPSEEEVERARAYAAGPARAGVREHERGGAPRGGADRHLRPGHRPRQGDRGAGRCHVRPGDGGRAGHLRRSSRWPASARTSSPSSHRAGLSPRRRVGHNWRWVTTFDELNHRELERYVRRVSDRWPLDRALLGGARVADLRGAGPQRERGPEYVIVLVSEHFDGVPWLERVYVTGTLWDAYEMGAQADMHAYTPAEFERKRENMPAVRDAAEWGLELLPEHAELRGQAPLGFEPRRATACVTRGGTSRVAGACRFLRRPPSCCAPSPTSGWSSSRAAGTERAFEAIVERYRGALLRAARRYLPDARAEDALQQAYLVRVERSAARRRGARPARLAVPDRPQHGSEPAARVGLRLRGAARSRCGAARRPRRRWSAARSCARR